MAIQEPLNFTPRPHIKVWGGDSLHAFLGQQIESDGPVGEVWTLVDRQEESTEVLGGEYEGRTLRGLMLSERSAVLGASMASIDDTFPFLIKLIDAAKDLSVQVHPDRSAAERLGGGAEAKDEFWYILSADPGARLYFGLVEGVDAGKFAACAAGPEVVDLMQSFEVQAGDFVYVPAGTVHSIGAGLRVVEVTENSDTTYRLYDWGRVGLDGQPRDCHLKDGLVAIDYENHPVGPRPIEVGDDAVNQVVPLCESRSFAVERLAIHEPHRHDTCGRAWAYVVLSGKGSLKANEVDGEWTLKCGQTWLLPASLGEYEIGSPDGELVVLRVEARA